MEVRTRRCVPSIESRVLPVGAVGMLSRGCVQEKITRRACIGRFGQAA
ncbi:hypothetical protein HMPREF9057_02455 [Actinomyces sp. oral taxon 171 str. F0337]|nr:hypothetical protein HMPREF9057_02455 [Actinomyces sp. oral taxon 171 str. F0337]